MDIARPHNFEEIKGNIGVIKRVKGRIIDGDLGKFHIITGQPGLGKTSLAYVMAKADNCLSTDPTSIPCGECDSCRDIDANVIEYERNTANVKMFAMPSEDAGEVIKQVISELNTNFLVRGKKYIILDELQNLSPKQQRDLLKPLETIPNGVVVIACATDMSSIEEALISRAQIHRLRLLSNNDLKWLLKKEAYRRQLRFSNTEDEDKALNYIISWADNKARPALKCLEALGSKRVVDIDEVMDMIEYLPLTDVIPIVTSFKGSYIKGIKVLESLTYDETTFKSLKLLLLDILKIANRELPKNISGRDFALVKEALSGLKVRTILEFYYYVTGIQNFDSSALISAFLKAHPALGKLSTPNKDQLELENASASMMSKDTKTTQKSTKKRLDVESMLRQSEIVEKE